MASKDPEELFNTERSETEEETIALRKKRARRVSFADREITSIHIFNRDQEYETPPQHSSASRRRSEVEMEMEEVSEVVRFFGDLVADSYDSKDMTPGEEDEDGDDDDEMAPKKSFLMPMESPGSSIIGGSATSNDENNFFGPVSANFIRPGRLSDSSASDINPDITMDSTAFSMHFRSIARSESGDLKTPTVVHIGFEEKTPSQVATSDSGNFMVFTKAKKPISQTSPPVGKVSGSRDSNDMSLVGENPHKFDYGRLSPSVEAILAKGSEDMSAVSIFGSASNAKPFKKSEVSIFQENGCGILAIKDNGDTDMCNVGPDDMSTGGVSVVNFELGEVNAGSSSTLLDQIIHDYPSNRIDDQTFDAHVDHQIETPNQLNRVNKFIKDVSESMLNVEFPAVSSDTPPKINVNSNVRRLGLISQNEHAELSPAEDTLKESSPKDGTHNSRIDELLNQQPGSPLAGSIMSLSAKKKQIFQDTTNSSRYPLYVTPSPKIYGSILRKENVKLDESLSSIHKSSSKFKIIESSNKASTLKDAIEKTKHRLSQYLSSATSPLSNVLEETSKDLQRKHMSAPIRNLEKDLFNADMMIEEPKVAMNMDGDGSGTPKNFSSLNQNEERRLAKDGESLDHLSNFTPVGKVTGMTGKMTAVASPSQLTCLSNNPLEGTSLISGSDSPILEVKHDHSKDHKTTDIPYKFVSPVKRLDQLLTSSMECQDNLSGDLKQQDQYKKLVNGSGLDENLAEFAPSDSHLTEKDDKLDSLVVEQRMQSSTPLLEINHLKDITQVKRVGNKELFSPDQRNVSEINRNFQTPSNDIDSLKYQSGSPYKNLQIRSDSTQDKDELPGEGTNASVCVPASPYVQRSLIEPSLLKSPSNKLPTQIPAWQEPSWSPSRKELCNFSVKDYMDLHVGKDGPSSKSYSDGHGNDDSRQGHHNSQSSFPLKDFDNSSGRKRRNEEIVIGNADNIIKDISIQRNPKVHKSGGNDLEQTLEHYSGSNKSNKKTGDDTTMKHWTDISRIFSTVTTQILSPLIDKLNIRAIDMLEDILVHLQKVDKYAMLSSEILSQRTYNQSENIRHKRVAETKLLLLKIVYEKAKLQIMHVKHEKLLKRGQLLSSGIQKSQILKLNYVSHLSGPGERDTHVDDNRHDSSLVNVEGKHEVAIDKVTSMRQVVESLDRKIKNIVKSHTYGKMKGEPSCAETILALNDHLKKKMLCRSICQDLQPWEIDDLERRNGHHNLILNYCGFICQRFAIIGDSAFTMISSKVNESNITKNFPNMDACTAFSFVFAAESTKKSVYSKSLAQETQTTSSLLLNLLSVVEEVQLARIEIRSLMQTIFNSPHADQLDLQLTFIDFDSGRRVTVILDMACLNRGVYPSEILPHQLHIPTTGMQKSLSAEIKVAIDNLPIGFSRIIRLCRCVSEALQSSIRQV
ncbi:hypothetical protein Ddye_015312 [Dipteronia dyeriana]|uniref:Knl1 C-terminal RWD domain-containing protein n=1 Tax=Dipteronia dyeriana TaxID=168575 RepID=A0AAD9WZ16_9ROSI|nr:hypothetical protein Ddye_015312 [Dipteronia dyeriana]